MRRPSLGHTLTNLPDRPSRSFGRRFSASMQSTRRRLIGVQDTNRQRETIVERNALVEQEDGGAFIDLCRIGAEALLLPLDEWGACLFHDASLADRRLARAVRVLRRAVVVFRSVLTIGPHRPATEVNHSLTWIAEPRPFPCRTGLVSTREFRLGVALGVTEQMRSSRSVSRFARYRNLTVPAIAIDSAVHDPTSRSTIHRAGAVLPANLPDLGQGGPNQGWAGHMMAGTIRGESWSQQSPPVLSKILTRCSPT